MHSPVMHSPVMHPGGPKILQLTAKALGLPDAAFAVSWEFLQQHGNTSGSSNLALVHRELMRAGTEESPRTRDIMCVGIGPGLALEGLLLRRMPPKQQGMGLIPRQPAQGEISRSNSRGRQGPRRSRSWVTARAAAAARGDDSGSCN
jgi:hypothetical protein